MCTETLPAGPDLVCSRGMAGLGLPRFPFRKVDHLHVLSHTIFKFLLKPHKERTIKPSLPLKPQALLTAPSMTISASVGSGLAALCARWEGGTGQATAAWTLRQPPPRCQLKGGCSVCDMALGCKGQTSNRT